jgi:ABC-type sugar transport system substrate-binding protein
MKKTIMWLTIVMLIVFVVGIGCEKKRAEKEAAKAEAPAEGTIAFEDLKIGYVMPYLEGWFGYWDLGWNIIMDKYGVDTETILTYWDPEKELQAVRDFITMGVDAISIESGNPDTAQVMCQLANEAGIPILIDSSSLSPGPGKPFFDISFDYGAMGALAAEKITEMWPGAKVLHMAGIAGFAPTEDQDESLKAGAEAGGYEFVGTEYTGYQIEDSKNILRDTIASGKEFDVILCGSQEIAEGSIEALKSADILDDVIVIVVNYGPLDIENFDQGELDYAIGQSVGLHAMVAAAVTLNYLQGIEPFSPVAHLPFQWLTPENHREEGITWAVDESWIPVAEKYAKTGILEY